MTLDLFEGRTDIWRGGLTPPKNTQTTSTGFPLLDKKLACGGWPEGSVVEILCGDDGTPPLWLIMPALARLSRRSAWITWVAPPFLPYAPALQAMGIELSRIMLVHPRNAAGGDKVKMSGKKTDREHLSDKCWALEQALKSGTASAVLGWLDNDNPRVLRRLQLAAEAGSTTGFIFRPGRYAQQQSNAAIRLCVDLHPRGLSIKILKCRGGWSNTDEPIRILFDQLPTYPINIATNTDKTFNKQGPVSKDDSASHTEICNGTTEDAQKSTAGEYAAATIKKYTNPQPYIAKAQRSIFTQITQPQTTQSATNKVSTKTAPTARPNKNNHVVDEVMSKAEDQNRENSPKNDATQLRTMLENRYSTANKQTPGYQTIDGKTIITTARKQIKNTTHNNHSSDNHSSDIQGGETNNSAGNVDRQTRIKTLESQAEPQTKPMPEQRPGSQPAPLTNGLDSILDLFANHKSSPHQTEQPTKEPEQ